jgi:hypothetical protein
MMGVLKYRTQIPQRITDRRLPGAGHYRGRRFSGHNAARMINGDARAGAGFRREAANLMIADD